MKRKLFSIDTQLYKVTGVEKVMLDIHHAVRDDYEAKIVGTIPYKEVNKDHNIPYEEYIHFHNPFMFYNSIVIVHERQLLLFLGLLNFFLFQKIKIVYIHHNLLYNHVKSTILPKTIVAIADRGIENLTKVFKAPSKDIHKIYNCVQDVYSEPHHANNNETITLLFPGRINNQKQQTEIVKRLRGKLDRRIKILFAGDGPNLDELSELCKAESQFESLGFRSDVKQLMQKCDYVFLYSVHEGLPITLIEASMLGVPIICSDVGGNPEICHDGKNGWVLNDWDSLIRTLNSLPNVSTEDYRRMCDESRRIYEENFTFDIFKKKYLKLLQYICYNQ